MAEGGEPSLWKPEESLHGMMNAATDIELESPDVSMMRKDRRDRTRAAMLVSVCGKGTGTRATMLVSVLGEGRGQGEGSNVGECLWGGKGTGRG